MMMLRVLIKGVMPLSMHAGECCRVSVEGLRMSEFLVVGHGHNNLRP